VFIARYVLHSTFCPHSVFMCGSDNKQRLFHCTALTPSVPSSQLWGGGDPVRVTGALRSREGPASVAYAFVFLSSITIARLYKLTRSDRSATESVFPLSLKSLAGLPVLGGPKNVFHSSPNPLPAALVFLLNRGVLHDEEVGLLKGKVREPPD